jgi:hypothetical protein
MKLVLATAALCLTLFAGAPQPAHAENPAESRQKIDAVIKAFAKALVDKDKEGFMRLFLREDITWVGVYTDGSLARYRASLKDPKEASPKTESSTPRKFIEKIVRAPEAHRNLRERAHRYRRRDGASAVRLQLHGRQLSQQLGQGKLADGPHRERVENCRSDLVGGRES